MYNMSIATCTTLLQPHIQHCYSHSHMYNTTTATVHRLTPTAAYGAAAAGWRGDVDAVLGPIGTAKTGALHDALVGPCHV